MKRSVILISLVLIIALMSTLLVACGGEGVKRNPENLDTMPNPNDEKFNEDASIDIGTACTIIRDALVTSNDLNEFIKYVNLELKNQFREIGVKYLKSVSLQNYTLAADGTIGGTLEFLLKNNHKVSKPITLINPNMKGKLAQNVMNKFSVDYYDGEFKIAEDYGTIEDRFEIVANKDANVTYNNSMEEMQLILDTLRTAITNNSTKEYYPIYKSLSSTLLSKLYAPKYVKSIAIKGVKLNNGLTNYYLLAEGFNNEIKKFRIDEKEKSNLYNRVISDKLASLNEGITTIRIIFNEDSNSVPTDKITPKVGAWHCQYFEGLQNATDKIIAQDTQIAKVEAQNMLEGVKSILMDYTLVNNNRLGTFIAKRIGDAPAKHLTKITLERNGNDITIKVFADNLPIGNGGAHYITSTINIYGVNAIFPVIINRVINTWFVETESEVDPDFPDNPDPDNPNPNPDPEIPSEKVTFPSTNNINDVKNALLHNLGDNFTVLIETKDMARPEDNIMQSMPIKFAKDTMFTNTFSTVYGKIDNIMVQDTLKNKLTAYSNKQNSGWTYVVSELSSNNDINNNRQKTLNMIAKFLSMPYNYDDVSTWFFTTLQAGAESPEDIILSHNRTYKVERYPSKLVLTISGDDIYTKYTIYNIGTTNIDVPTDATLETPDNSSFPDVEINDYKGILHKLSVLLKDGNYTANIIKNGNFYKFEVTKQGAHATFTLDNGTEEIAFFPSQNGFTKYTLTNNEWFYQEFKRDYSNVIKMYSAEFADILSTLYRDDCKANYDPNEGSFSIISYKNDENGNLVEVISTMQLSKKSNQLAIVLDSRSSDAATIVFDRFGTTKPMDAITNAKPITTPESDPTYAKPNAQEMGEANIVVNEVNALITDEYMKTFDKNFFIKDLNTALGQKLPYPKQIHFITFGIDGNIVFDFVSGSKYTVKAPDLLANVLALINSDDAIKLAVGIDGWEILGQSAPMIEMLKRTVGNDDRIFNSLYNPNDKHYDKAGERDTFINSFLKVFKDTKYTPSPDPNGTPSMDGTMDITVCLATILNDIPTPRYVRYAQVVITDYDNLTCDLVLGYNDTTYERIPFEVTYDEVNNLLSNIQLFTRIVWTGDEYLITLSGSIELTIDDIIKSTISIAKAECQTCADQLNVIFNEIFYSQDTTPVATQFTTQLNTAYGYPTPDGSNSPGSMRKISVSSLNDVVTIVFTTNKYNLDKTIFTYTHTINMAGLNFEPFEVKWDEVNKVYVEVPAIA